MKNPYGLFGWEEDELKLELEKTKKGLIISKTKLKEYKEGSELWNLTKTHIEWLKSEIERLT